MPETTNRIEAVDITERFARATEEVCKGREDLRKRIDKTLNQLLNNPAAPGLHRHPIRTTRLKELSSSRVTDSVRLIDQQADMPRLTALHVGTHDPSYDLAERIQGDQWRIVFTMRRPDESNRAACGDETAATNAATNVFDGRFAQARTIPPAGPGKGSCDVIPLKELTALGLPDAVARRVREADPDTAWGDYGLAEYADPITKLWVTYLDRQCAAHSNHTGEMASGDDAKSPPPVPITSTVEETDALDAHSISKAVVRARPTTQNAQVQPPLPIPLATENDVFVITTPGQFAQMAELGLDRYLAVMTGEQRELARATQTGLLVVQGSGGSGKTTVAVHRTRFLADQIIAQPKMLDDRPRRVLYVCFNHALAQTVNQLLASLYGEQPPDHIEVTTLHAWAKDYLIRRGALRDAHHPQHLSAYRRLENTDGWIANSVRRHQREALSRGGNILWRRYPIQFFVTEIMQVIVGRGLRTLEDYLAADRSGRGIGLSAADRHLIWGLYEDWRSGLQMGGVMDLASLPGLALEELQQDPGFAPYEAVIIDEAQDFTPVQLRLAIRLAGGNLSHVTVFADAAQVIYPTGFSWKLAELNPRGGQIRMLRQNLRNTVEIHEAAQQLLGRCTRSETREEFSKVEPPRTHGQPPEILICADASAEEAAVCRRLRTQLAKGIPPQTIAVLAGTHEKLKLMGEAMRRWNIPYQAVNEGRRISITHPSIKVLTMHSAKGLDFPHVYIVGLTTNGLPGSQSDHPDVADDESLERQRRLLYTAMIRAGSTLVLSTIAGNEHALMADLRDSDCRRHTIQVDR